MRKKPTKPIISHGKRSRTKRARYTIALATFALVSVGLSAIVGPGTNLFGARKVRSLFAAQPVVPPPAPPPSSPTKEYIYAGSRLLATEEPVSMTSAPSLVATSVTLPAPPYVEISWSPITGADHYQVERTPSIGTAFTSVNANVVGTSFTDTSVTAVTAYLYRVRAVDGGGNVSPYSNVDLATAITFTDDVLQIGTTVVKKDHVTELRQAVNAARATAGLSADTWAEAITSQETTVKASHLQELRTQLNGARSVLGLTPCSFTNDPVTNGPILKDHIEQLRLCVK